MADDDRFEKEVCSRIASFSKTKLQDYVLALCFQLRENHLVPIDEPPPRDPSGFTQAATPYEAQARLLVRQGC
jgi:hypothetical protein